MKNKSLFFITALFSATLIGCNDVKTVENYPLDNASETALETADNTVSQNGDTINYMIMDNSGTKAYEINAIKSGSEEEAYPVYEVLPHDYTDDDIKKFCLGIFDEGSISVILPSFLTQSDYVENRILTMTKRKEEFESSGQAVPGYIYEDLKDLNERRNSNNLNAVYTLTYTNEMGFIDLHNFFLDELNADVDCRFCFVEGTIDGEYYRVDFINYQNNTMVKIYRLDEFFHEAPLFYTMADDEHYPFDKETFPFTKEEAVSTAQDFLGKMNIAGYSPIAAYPACIYGRSDSYDEIPKEKDDIESGYACYFAREVNGKIRPYNSYIENGSFLIPRANNLVSLGYYNDYGVTNALETNEGSGIYRSGYEFICVCLNSQGVISCFWNSPSDVGEIKTDQAQLLTFDQIDTQAQKYLEYYTNNVDEFEHYKTPLINEITLSMARTTDDNGHYYMVPAWYYFLKSDQLQVDKRSAVCINAIDGSIIDIEHGGNTITIN